MSPFVGWGIFLAIFVIVVVATFLTVASRYKRCPSDKILVIYGKIGGKKTGEKRAAICIHGGAAFVWPLIQDYQYLDLTPISIDIPLTEALSKENIRVNAPSTFTVGIATEAAIMGNAAERLLGLTNTSVQKIAEDIIFGQFRATIATMKIEEINVDREKFQKAVMDNVETELRKIGLRVINVNIKDITDESGYIEALGRKAAAEAINQAKIDVAEQNRNGETGEANANKEKRINVSKAEADAVTGENEAEKVKVDSISSLRQATAEFEKTAVIAEKTKAAQSEETSYEAQKKAEIARKERDLQTQLANVVPPAEAAKRKTIIDAEADAEKRAMEGRGEGEKIKNAMSGEAQGIQAILEARAEGFARIVQAAEGSPRDAFMLLIVEKLPELVKMQTEAIRNLEIDKIVVWDGGDGKATPNFVSNLITSLPGLHEICKTAGLSLPDLMGKQIEEADKDAAAPKE